jgi:hypothetical protein
MQEMREPATAGAPATADREAAKFSSGSLGHTTGALDSQESLDPREPRAAVQAPAAQDVLGAGIQILDSLGTPVGGLRVYVLTYYLHSGLGRTYESGLTLTPEQVRRLGQPTITNSNGWIPRPPMCRFAVACAEDEDSILVTHRGDRIGQSPPLGVTIAPELALFPRTAVTRKVTLLSGVRVTARVRFADFLPYSGEAALYCGPVGSRDSYYLLGEPIEVAQGRVDLGLLPVNYEVTLVARDVSRPDFASFQAVQGIVWNGLELDLVIPHEDKPKYGVQVDLSILFQGQTARVSVWDATGSLVSEGLQRGPGIWRSRPLRLEGPPVVVFVSGDAIGRSEPMLMTTDPWPTYVVPAQIPATIRVRVLDKNGLPVVPSVLLYDPDHRFPLVLLSSAKPPTGRTFDSVAFADSAGEIIFQGAAPGRHTVRIRALGFHHADLEYSAESGHLVDLGDVVLEALSDLPTSITVVLNAPGDPTTYQCTLLRTGAGVLRDPVPFSADGKVVFEGLEFGAYTVGVTGEGGTTGVNLILDRAEPHRTVRIEPQ